MTFLPNQYEHHDGCIDHATCDGMLRARDEAVYAMAQEIARLQKLVEGLTARVAAQSELLGRRAERRET